MRPADFSTVQRPSQRAAEVARGDGSGDDSNPRRLSELDALRGLGALMVVGYHYTTDYRWPYGHTAPVLFYVPWGFHGVQLFFAISGFVIFMTLARTRRPLDFIVSRFSRLYPAYWVSMLLTTAIVWAAGLDDQKVSLLTFVENVPMIQGAFSRIKQVDGVYWTLAVELCFYGCMFGLFLGRMLEKIEPILILWIGLKWIRLQVHLPHIVSFLLVQNHIPFFAIGICCYRLMTGAIDWRWAAIILTFATVTTFCVDSIEMGLVACITAAIFLLIATAGASWLRAKPLIWFGTISYTLYLLHGNIGSAIIRNFELRHIDSNIAVAVAAVSSIMLAMAMTILIEQPAMKRIRERYRERVFAIQQAGGGVS
jgi:peptidoglycan/LPS O-acetylase OafA/YrhL